MPTALDIRIRPRVAATIAKKGKPVLLGSVIEGEYDTATSSSSDHTVVYAVTGVVESPLKLGFDRTLVRAGDAGLLLADYGLPNDVKPKAGDTIDFDDGEAAWTIVAVLSTYSGELVALYRLLLRK